MKKEYLNPKMEIVDFSIMSSLLCGSGCEEKEKFDYDDEFAFNFREFNNHNA